MKRDYAVSDPSSMEAVRSVSGVSSIAAVLSRIKRKDTPPPYEDPPSYEVAVQMERGQITFIL